MESYRRQKTAALFWSKGQTAISTWTSHNVSSIKFNMFRTELIVSFLSTSLLYHLSFLSAHPSVFPVRVCHQHLPRKWDHLYCHIWSIYLVNSTSLIAPISICSFFHTSARVIFLNMHNLTISCWNWPAASIVQNRVQISLILIYNAFFKNWFERKRGREG